MTKNALNELSTQTLVERFTRICEEQYDAIWFVETQRYNRLYRQMRDVVAELRRRPGDQRRELAKLYDHPNLKVRLMAAHATLALFYEQARQVIQTVADSDRLPFSVDAKMSLRGLDDGSYKPT